MSHLREIQNTLGKPPEHPIIQLQDRKGDHAADGDIPVRIEWNDHRTTKFVLSERPGHIQILAAGMDGYRVCATPDCDPEQLVFTDPFAHLQDISMDDPFPHEKTDAFAEHQVAQRLGEGIVVVSDHPLVVPANHEQIRLAHTLRQPIPQPIVPEEASVEDTLEPGIGMTEDGSLLFAVIPTSSHTGWMVQSWDIRGETPVPISGIALSRDRKELWGIAIAEGPVMATIPDWPMETTWAGLAWHIGSAD